jgi:hypothetical protein
MNSEVPDETELVCVCATPSLTHSWSCSMEHSERGGQR